MNGKSYSNFILRKGYLAKISKKSSILFLNFTSFQNQKGGDYIISKGSCFISFLSQKKKRNYIIYKKDIIHFFGLVFSLASFCSHWGTKGKYWIENLDPGDFKVKSVVLSSQENYSLMILLPLPSLWKETERTLLQVTMFPKSVRLCDRYVKSFCSV